MFFAKMVIRNNSLFLSLPFANFCTNDLLLKTISALQRPSGLYTCLNTASDDAETCQLSGERKT